MTQPRQQGFALFVIAALFVAFALVAAAMIDRTTNLQHLDNFRNTKAQVSRLSYALIRYKLETGRYPCPANPALDPYDVNFGIGVNCQDDTIASNNNLEKLTATVWRGMVPFRDLMPYGITQRDVYDAWGSRIMYNSDRTLANGGSGTQDPAETMSVEDIHIFSTFYYRPPEFLVISYGPDRMGAYSQSGSRPLPCGTNGRPQDRNCAADANFKLYRITMGPSVPINQYFDDILSFY